MVRMIIKGLFRRYERWNPVHPTSGAFWGTGIGVGCGVGWGPGFGPEVVGYVGAGCGVGFSVGITLAGFGVGLPLPANSLFQVPYNAVMATRSGALEFARSTDTKHVAENGWNNIAFQISGLKREASGRLSSFKQSLFDKGVDMLDMKSILSGRTSSIPKTMETISRRFFGPRKGLKD